MPFAYTQPTQLAALFGFSALAAGQVNVLELGCASGENIILQRTLVQLQHGTLRAPCSKRRRTPISATR